MSNPSGRLGADTEAGLVLYLQGHGFPHAERRVTNGNKDRGDVTGCVGICWEAKGGNAAALASPGQIAEWMVETYVETKNARADYGLLVTKRAGVGPARAGLWWAYLDSHAFLELSGAKPTTCPPSCTVRVTLAEAVALLRHAGYGDEPSAVSA